MTESAFLPLLARAADGKNLGQEQAVRAFQIIMNGGATPAQMAAFLTALRMKGETAEEIAGGAEALRAKASAFKTPGPVFDTCGTGGDGHGTYNISTAAALVLAACGVKVAKHGNRAVSSRSGSADVLEALGVKTDADAPTMQRALENCGFCFLLAPRYHPAMRHVAPVRQELGFRTIFNLLGPLANPAKPAWQLLGVYSEALLEPMARTLQALELQRAWVVHGEDGGDELSISGPSHVVELHEGKLQRFSLTPEDAGLPRHPADALKGGDALANAKALEAVLMSQKGAYRDAVLLNAAAGLIIAGMTEALPEAVVLAAQAIDEGKAFTVLKKCVDITRQPAHA